MSISNVPGRQPASTLSAALPLVPAMTLSTSGESGSMVITTSLRSATWRGLSAVCAPPAASSSIAARLRL